MRTRVWLTAAALATAAVLTACSGSGSDSSAGKAAAAEDERSAPPSSSSKAPDPTHDVKIVKSGFEDSEMWGPDAYVVRYSITNHGNGPADYFAQFEFLDKDGDVLGTTGVTADKLGAGKSKRGDTAPLQSEIENGPMKDIRSVRVSQVERN